MSLDCAELCLIVSDFDKIDSKRWLFDFVRI